LDSSRYGIDYAGGMRGKTRASDQLKVNGRLQKILRPFIKRIALVKEKFNGGLIWRLETGD
jgi:hypothetical protein